MLAPLRRKNTGAITPEIQWLLYAENELAPLRRKLTLVEKAAQPEKVDLEMKSYARSPVANTALAGTAGGMVAKGTLSFASGLTVIGDLLGDATGFRGWFNDKLVGNPRGICLFNCGNEKRVNQNVQIDAVLAYGGEETRIMSEARTVTDDFVPDLLIPISIDKAVLAIR
jgi:hypothetical protein